MIQKIKCWFGAHTPELITKENPFNIYASRNVEQWVKCKHCGFVHVYVNWSNV